MTDKLKHAQSAIARRASLSSSCRCASKEEVCQTRGSPSQKCQRMSREPSGAGYK